MAGLRMLDTRPMARFVLVHGGWHGGWCFRWLAKELADRGHDVATPDLPCEDIISLRSRRWAAAR
jgi:hypothetical protein